MSHFYHCYESSDWQRHLTSLLTILLHPYNLRYRAPEVLLKSSAYTCAVDLWAAGTIAAELISLKPLFPGSSDVDQINRIGSALGSPTQVAHEEQATGTTIINGSGGEWKEGVQLAAKMGVSFPQVSSFHNQARHCFQNVPPISGAHG